MNEMTKCVHIGWGILDRMKKGICEKNRKWKNKEKLKRGIPREYSSSYKQATTQAKK